MTPLIRGKLIFKLNKDMDLAFRFIRMVGCMKGHGTLTNVMGWVTKFIKTGIST
jgi:hypothetical protein